VTESVSGFLSPEERAAMENRRQGEQDDDLADVGSRVIQVLAELGPTALPELIDRVRARPRFVMKALDKLEQSGLVTISARGVEEVAELTNRGQSRASAWAPG
jgi:hypothetical protein